MKQKQLKQQNRYVVETVTWGSENKTSWRKVSPALAGGLVHKAALLLLLLMATGAGASAQWQWGVKLGTNASTQSGIGNICDNTDLRVGMNGGIVAEAPLNHWLALRSGVGYQLKGKKSDLPEEEATLDSKLNYLVLPVKAKFSASEKAGFKNGQRLFFATGPYMGYLLSANQTLSGATTGLNELNAVDFGWTLELGMEFPAAAGHAFQVSLDYDMGIREIAEATSLQNKSASLNLGFLF